MASKNADARMAAILKQVMEELEEIGRSNDELYDTVVRENLFEAVCAGFLKPQPGFRIYDDFGMDSQEANRRVGAALERYIQAAGERAQWTPLGRCPVRGFGDLEVFGWRPTGEYSAPESPTARRSGRRASG